MNKQIPDFFRPLFWSYDFSTMDPTKHQKTVIVNTVNFGNLHHWKWIKECYGTPAIQTTLQTVPTTELRPPAKRLAEVLFHIDIPAHVSRGVASSK